MKWPSTSGHPGLSSEAGAVEGTGEKDGWGGVASILGLALSWMGSGKDAEGQNLGSGAPQRGQHGGKSQNDMGTLGLRSRITVQARSRTKHMVRMARSCSANAVAKLQAASQFLNCFLIH